jgi:ankyrin repeat protein
LLISKGADVNAKGYDGATPLRVAALFGHTTTAKFLISKGADVNAKTNDGKTPLQCAGRESYTAMVGLLKPKISEDKFLNAVKNGDVNTVKKALAQGMNVNKRDKDGWTPLHLAACYCHTAILDLLISKGADVNAKGYDGATPLRVAALFGHTTTAELLRKHRAHE